MIVQRHSRSFVLVWRGHPSCSSRLILMNNALRLASHHRRQPEKLASEQACHERDTAGAREEADDADRHQSPGEQIFHDLRQAADCEMSPIGLHPDLLSDEGARSHCPEASRGAGEFRPDAPTDHVERAPDDAVHARPREKSGTRSSRKRYR